MKYLRRIFQTVQRIGFILLFSKATLHKGSKVGKLLNSWFQKVKSLFNPTLDVMSQHASAIFANAVIENLCRPLSVALRTVLVCVAKG